MILKTTQKRPFFFLVPAWTAGLACLLSGCIALPFIRSEDVIDFEYDIYKPEEYTVFAAEGSCEDYLWYKGRLYCGYYDGDHITYRNLGDKMQFVIDELEYQKTWIVVTGETPVGTVKGIWKDRKEPVVGNVYHIELNIGNPKEVKISCQNSVPFVYLDRENIVFTGLCEGGDNEVYYLRFAVDWLEMLDIDVITPRKKGDCISFSADWRNIEIYPYNL